MNEKPVSETEFNLAVDEIITAVEDALDESGADVDYESSGGVLTITCEVDGSQVIVSRQPAIRQIWVAARSGGFHCSLSGDEWICSTTGETLQALLSRVCSEQTGEEVLLSF